MGSDVQRAGRRMGEIDGYVIDPAGLCGSHCVGGQADITVALVAELVAEQFRRWAHLPVRPVALDGWDNTTFRLGDTNNAGSRCSHPNSGPPPGAHSFQRGGPVSVWHDRVDANLRSLRHDVDVAAARDVTSLGSRRCHRHEPGRS